MIRIKRGDNVLIIAGKDKGKQGLVEKVLRSDNKLIVTGVNMAKRSLKPSRKNPHGGIINLPMPISVSNVMLVCPHCGKPVRIAYKINAKNKERICRKCQGNLDVKTSETKDKNVKSKS